MLKTLWATIRHGKIELLESTELPEGVKVLVTLLTTAVKRGVYTVQGSLVIKAIGQLVDADAEQLEQSLRGWLNL